VAHSNSPTDWVNANVIDVRPKLCTVSATAISSSKRAAAFHATCTSTTIVSRPWAFNSPSDPSVARNSSVIATSRNVT